MNRYLGVSQFFGDFKSGVVRGISYIGLEKSRISGASPICQDLLFMDGASRGNRLKGFDAQIYVNY